MSSSTDDFGYMLDLILALRVHGVPLDALNLGVFTEKEQGWIRAGYEIRLSELMCLDSAKEST